MDLSGLAYRLRSLMTYIVAFKMIDMVIVGLDELKSVMIISSKPKELGEVIMKELGLGPDHHAWQRRIFWETRGNSIHHRRTSGSCRT